MPYEVRVQLGESPQSAEQSLRGIADPKEALDAVGQRLYELLNAFRPDRIAFGETVGADTVELEVGFAIEAAPGALVKLIIAPKGSVSCKAKLTWKRPDSTNKTAS